MSRRYFEVTLKQVRKIASAAMMTEQFNKLPVWRKNPHLDSFGFTYTNNCQTLDPWCLLILQVIIWPFMYNLKVCRVYSYFAWLLTYTINCMTSLLEWNISIFKVHNLHRHLACNLACNLIFTILHCRTGAISYCIRFFQSKQARISTAPV